MQNFKFSASRKQKKAQDGNGSLSKMMNKKKKNNQNPRIFLEYYYAISYVFIDFAGVPSLKIFGSKSDVWAESFASDVSPG